MTIGVSPNTPGVVYVGTDDANVWVTSNDGGLWTNITAGLPERWVTRVTVHPTDPNTAYVTLSGYKVGDHAAHSDKTTNAGANWTPIGGNLFDAPINDVVIDPDHPESALYIATDFGVYMTNDDGANWIALDQGMPAVTPVHDIDFHQATRKLAAGTHGRSMYAITVFSSTAPTVAQKYPRAHRCCPQYRLRRCWKSRCNIRDDRPFRNCTSFAGANWGGATTNMWTWSGDTAPRTMRTSRAAQISRSRSRARSATSPRSTWYRYFVIHTR
jgi:photosystem II stability/assembly factor-like uncharacterized protein